MFLKFCIIGEWQVQSPLGIQSELKVNLDNFVRPRLKTKSIYDREREREACAIAYQAQTSTGPRFNPQYGVRSKHLGVNSRCSSSMKLHEVMGKGGEDKRVHV